VTFSGVLNVSPPSVLLDIKISLSPNGSLCHITYTILLLIAIDGRYAKLLFSLMIFSGVLNVSPPSVLLEIKILGKPFESSLHTTNILFPSIAICGINENPLFSLIFSGVLNVSPPSVLLEKKISEVTELSLSSSHAT
jgi:hypothetical protein